MSEEITLLDVELFVAENKFGKIGLIAISKDILEKYKLVYGDILTVKLRKSEI